MKSRLLGVIAVFVVFTVLVGASVAYAGNRGASVVVADPTLTWADMHAELTELYRGNEAAAETYMEAFCPTGHCPRASVSKLLYDPFYGCKPVGYLGRCAGTGSPKATATPEPEPEPEP